MTLGASSGCESKPASAVAVEGPGIATGPHNRCETVLVITSFPRREDRTIEDLNALADVVFSLSPGALLQKTVCLCGDPGLLEAIRRVSRAVGSGRSWNLVAKGYRDFVDG
jgi:hypothetical protein